MIDSNRKGGTINEQQFCECCRRWAVKLPIEKKYQKDIQKWLKDTMAETGLPIERVVTEVFLHRMSHNNIHPEHRKK